MNPMLSRAELLRELDRSYSRFIAEIEKLSDDQLAVVGVTKMWSVRDLLAHMLFWHDSVERRAAGTPVEWDQGPGETREAYIGRAQRKSRGRHEAAERPTGGQAFKESHARILQLARTITETQLADQALMESFLGDTYGHYDEHFASLQEFVNQHKRQDG